MSHKLWKNEYGEFVSSEDEPSPKFRVGVEQRKAKMKPKKQLEALEQKASYGKEDERFYIKNKLARIVKVLDRNYEVILEPYPNDELLADVEKKSGYQFNRGPAAEIRSLPFDYLGERKE